MFTGFGTGTARPSTGHSTGPTLKKPNVYKAWHDGTGSASPGTPVHQLPNTIHAIELGPPNRLAQHPANGPIRPIASIIPIRPIQPYSVPFRPKLTSFYD